MAGPVRQVSHAQALQLILDAGLAAGAVGFQLFQAESQVFAHDGKDDLVFGILRNTKPTRRRTAFRSWRVSSPSTLTRPEVGKAGR